MVKNFILVGFRSNSLSNTTLALSDAEDVTAGDQFSMGLHPMKFLLQFQILTGSGMWLKPLSLYWAIFALQVLQSGILISVVISTPSAMKLIHSTICY